MPQIRNEEIYKQKVEESVVIRTEINEKLWAKMNILSKEFVEATGFTRRDFSIAKNSIYYTGGWPHKTTKARMESAVDNFASMVKILHFLGRTQELSGYLNEFGLRVEVLVHHPILNANSKQAANRAIDLACTLQGKICGQADLISVSNSAAVKTECDIQKKHFVSEVNIRAKKRAKSQKHGVEVFKEDFESAEKVLGRIESI